MPTNEFEKLGGADNGVRNGGSLNSIFLCHLRAEKAAGLQPFVPTTEKRKVMTGRPRQLRRRGDCG